VGTTATASLLGSQHLESHRVASALLAEAAENDNVAAIRKHNSLSDKDMRAATSGVAGRFKRSQHADANF